MLEGKYFLSKRNIEPAIFITPTDNWITLQVRYIVEVRDRRIIHNKLASRILEVLQGTPEITIASQTMTVTSVSSN